MLRFCSARIAKPYSPQSALVLEQCRGEPERHLARLRFVPSVQEEVVAVRRLAGIVDGEVPAAVPGGVAVHCPKKSDEV